MNPARAFGPELVQGGAWSDAWIYYVGPFVGGVLAAVLYTVLYLPVKRRPTRRPPPQRADARRAFSRRTEQGVSRQGQAPWAVRFAGKRPGASVQPARKPRRAEREAAPRGVRSRASTTSASIGA